MRRDQEEIKRALLQEWDAIGVRRDSRDRAHGCRHPRHEGDRVPPGFWPQPILNDEGNWVDASTDLRTWRRLIYLSGTEMPIELDGPARYLRFHVTADRFSEITGEADGQPLDRSGGHGGQVCHVAVCD